MWPTAADAFAAMLAMPTAMHCRRSLLLSLLVLTGVAIHGAQGADLPGQFVGVWRLMDGADRACKKTDWNSNELRSDVHINITSRMIEFYESRCQYASIRVPRNSTDAVLNLTCSGEGMRWRETNIWHVHRVGPQSILILVNTKESLVHVYRHCQ
jgi:hypothetical protein